MKNILKKFIPDFIFSWYHFVLSFCGALLYGFPSKKLIVIGVTGTNGKSTTVNLIERLLSHVGFKTGLVSTYNIKIAGREEYNKTKLTMPGRFFLQYAMKKMLEAGCRFVVVETSSEGILQHRHRFIHYDAAVFTNLTPEHIERHGGFENYKKAKLCLFKHLENLPHKYLGGKKIEKVIVANVDDKYAKDFLNFQVDRKITFSLDSSSDFQAVSIQENEKKVQFEIRNSKFEIRLPGRANVLNSAAAIATVSNYGVDLRNCVPALSKVKGIPGRMEWINEGQNFKILVDYAPEPASMTFLYDTVKKFSKAKTIHVLGSAGGGRDRSRRPVLGKLAAESADLIIVTNEDPYDENPQTIIDEVAQGARGAGKEFGKSLFKIVDRRQAIAKALSLAQNNDLIMVTGKGSEQYMVMDKGRKVPWDDRKVIREELGKIPNNTE